MFRSAICLLCLYLVVPAPVLCGPTKRALLVGISKYDRGGPNNWWNLNSEPDVAAIKSLLQTKFGFAESEIKILIKPEETTRESILKTFQSYLIDETQPGDIVYFHYSGHGGQAPDDNEEEIDGLDEVLIPIDYVSTEDHSNDVRDDVLGNLIDGLSAKKPSSLTLTFDCCFSGTNTRGGRMAVRGRAWQGPTPVLKGTRGGEDKSPSGLMSRGAGKNDIAVVIAATRSDQVATETDDDNNNDMGLLSYALTKAMAEATPQSTYRDLFDRVNDIMTSRVRDQNPQLEGDPDKILFQGIALKPEPFVYLDVDRRDNVILKAGYLQGMTTGSKFAIYSRGTKDFKSTPPMATGVIEATDATESVIRLDSSDAARVKLEDVRQARAQETLHEYADNLLKVDAAGVESLPNGNKLMDRLKTLPLVTMAEPSADQWDVRVASAGSVKQTLRGDGTMDPSTVVIQRNDGSIIAATPPGDDMPVKVQRALEGESRWRLVKSLENRNPDSDVVIEMRVVPVEAGKDARGNPAKVTKRLDQQRTPGGQFTMAERDYFILEIRNTGFRDAYVTILDLRSDGKIGPLWPDPMVKNDNNLLPRDKEWHSVPLSSPAKPWIFEVEEGFLGTEIFKAIATVEQTDFSPLLDEELIRRGGETRSGQSPIGRILKAATAGQRSNRASIDPTDWSTSTVNCWIATK